MGNPKRWYFHEVGSVIYVLEQTIRQDHLQIERYQCSSLSENHLCKFFVLNHLTNRLNNFSTTITNEIKCVTLESRVRVFFDDNKNTKIELAEALQTSAQIYNLRIENFELTMCRKLEKKRGWEEIGPIPIYLTDPSPAISSQASPNKFFFFFLNVGNSLSLSLSLSLENSKNTNPSLIP